MKDVYCDLNIFSITPVQETCRTNMNAYTSRYYYHGLVSAYVLYACDNKNNNKKNRHDKRLKFSEIICLGINIY